VNIQDGNSQPVANANVVGQWIGDFDQSSVNGQTDTNGVVTFDSVQVSRSATGNFIFNVIEVSKDGYTHDSSADVVISGCVDTTGTDCGSGPGIPPSPTNLAASSFDNAVTLEWTYDTAADEFNVYRADTSGSYGSPIATVSSKNYLDVAVVANNTYYYVVTAVSGGVESDASSEVSVTASSDPAIVMEVPSPFMVAISGRGANKQGVATVQVVDGSGALVDNAVVEGFWEIITSSGTTIPLGPQASGTTDVGGETVITSDKYRATTGDKFRLTVTNVTRSGYAYDSQTAPQPFGEAQVN
jgi:fibronectin type 3 domain-containing protein